MIKQYKHCNIPVLTVISAVFIVLSVIPVHGETYNWSQWKGPGQNGISSESGWDPACLKQPLAVNWRKNVGTGFSNVAIAGDYLYTMGFDKKRQENGIYCLDINTGKEVWKYSYKASSGKYEGPRCGPVIDDGLVYTFGQDGDFLCNNAATGTLVWRKNVVSSFGAENLMWQFGCSVRIEGDRAMVNACHHGVTLHKKTGALIWKSDPGKGNYTTPVTYQAGEQTYAAIYGNTHLHAVNVEDGTVAWSFPWKTTYSIIAADPYVYGDKIFISTGYKNGCALIDISRGRPVELWRNKNLSTHFSTAVIIDGFIYGIDGNAGTDAYLKCLDLKNGSVRWKEELGFGNMIAANGYLIMVNEKGSLIIVEATPAGYREVSRKDKILGRKCWTAPVLCRSTIYLRNDQGDLVSLDVSRKETVTEEK